MGEPAKFDAERLDYIAAWLAGRFPNHDAPDVIRAAIAAHARLQSSYNKLFNAFAEQTGLGLALGEREK